MKASKSTARIAIDAMGGDFAPRVNVEGTLMALESTEGLHAILVGRDEAIRGELLKLNVDLEGRFAGRLSILHAEEVISMEDHGASVIRKKRNSSLHLGLGLVKDGKADAFISAGNSGAVMAGALLILGRLADVERPAILIKLPTAEGFIIILDGGANVDCRPSHLLQFAEMGFAYAEIIEGISSPRIGLLSNGSESHKGNELTRETQALLKPRTDLNYVGYIEGNDLFQGKCDVVVCDGFVGNVVLKLAEGLADTSYQWFRTEIRKDVFGLVGAILMRKILKSFKRKFDYQPYGAAPLMGIDGMVMISHGASTGIAIRNGILTAKRGVEEDFIHKMATRLGQKTKDEHTT